MHHELKTVNPYFQRVWDGQKNFEIRLNDRDFQTGDTLTLREYEIKNNSYSGREVFARVGYILNEYKGLEPGFVIFQIDNPMNQDINETTI